MFLTKDKIRQIIENAPQGTTPGGVIAALRSKGVRLEGYDQSISGQAIDKIKSADVRSAETYGASFPAAVGEDTPLTTIAKTVGNLPSSALNLVKGVGSFAADALRSPIDAITGIGSQIKQGAAAQDFSARTQASTELDNRLSAQYIKETDPAKKDEIRRQLLELRGGVGQAPVQQAPTRNAVLGLGTAAVEGVTKLLPGEQQTPQFDAVVEGLKERYGSLDNLQRTITNDPFGFATEILSLAQGGAAALGKTQQLNNVLSKTAQVATKPVKMAVGSISPAASKLKSVAGYGVSQATGLERGTLKTLVEQPSASYGVDRMGVANDIKSAINSRIKQISETGKGYETVRTSESVVNVPKGTIESVLQKYGVKLEDGKILTGPESRPLSLADKSAIESFIKTYGSERQLSSNAFLNTREALDQIAKFGDGKTSVSKAIAREIRYQYDQLGKAQIKGLEDLDTAYSAERTILNQAKKDFIDAKTGQLKDSALSRIANATGKGKDALLSRMETLSPGITKKLQVLKAAEDIEKASGIKVGTYVRAGLTGAGIATGNIPLVISAIIANPSIAVPLIKGYGLTRAQIARVVGILRSTQVSQFIAESAKSISLTGKELNNFEVPTAVKEYIKNPKAGMSIQKVQSAASNIDDANLISEARKYKTAEEFASNYKNNPKIQAIVHSGETPETVKIKDLFLSEDAGTAKLGFGKGIEAKNLTPGRSIDEPILVLGKNTVIDGHTRIQQAIANGEDTIKIYRVKPVGEVKSQLTDIWNKANKK